MLTPLFMTRLLQKSHKSKMINSRRERLLSFIILLFYTYTRAIGIRFNNWKFQMRVHKYNKLKWLPGTSGRQAKKDLVLNSLKNIFSFYCVQKFIIRGEKSFCLDSDTQEWKCAENRFWCQNIRISHTENRTSCSKMQKYIFLMILLTFLYLG